jgi:hypothetical protein
MILSASATICSTMCAAGSIRRECLNHVLVLGERHLRRILTRYLAYTIRRAPTSLSTRTHPTSGLSSFRRRGRSCSFPKSAACTTATSVRPRNPAPPGVLPAQERPSSLLLVRPLPYDSPAGAGRPPGPAWPGGDHGARQTPARRRTGGSQQSALLPRVARYRVIDHPRSL